MNTSKKSLVGFSLIELMVTVAIVAILASISLPMYQSQVRKSRRTDAKTALLDLAGREEKYYSLNNVYTSSPASLGYSGTGFTISNYYTGAVCVASNVGSTATTTGCTGTSGTTGSSFIVSAIPSTGSSQLKDASCQYFAVDNTGTQYSSSTSSVGSDSTSTCWQ